MKLHGYVIHVKNAYEREEHIKNQIKSLSIPFDFILYEVDDKIIASNFKGSLGKVSGESSCTDKHFAAYRDMIENDIDYGIIFENDIFISKNFEKAIHKAISEIEERKIKDIFLSLEDSYFRFVPGSQRIKGQTVYKTDGSNTRCAGAYLVDLQCAKTLINEVNLNKCDCVIDHFHTYCAKIGLIDVYWLHPTIASQGSRNGKLKSLFRERKLWYPKIFRRISYIVQRLYKRFLWRMR